MEIRKVQITGGASYVISLPKSWARSLNLKKNDPLGVLIQSDGTLLITPKISENKEQQTKELDIEIINTQSGLIRYLVGAYISGYSYIKIKSSTQISPAVRAGVRRFTQMTIGQEVVEEGENYILLKNLLNPVEMPFKKTIHRMYVIVRSMHEEAITVLERRDERLAEDVISRDNDVDRLHWLVARQYNLALKDINVARVLGVTPEMAGNFFLISRIMERIGDHAVRIAKNVVNLKDKKIDNKTIASIVSASNLALAILDTSIEPITKGTTKTPSEHISILNENIDTLTKLISLCEDINHIAVQQRSPVAIAIGYIVESIRRTGEYAADISEALINTLI
jgi:phosphate uptake regulator